MKHVYDKNPQKNHKAKTIINRLPSISWDLICLLTVLLFYIGVRFGHNTKYGKIFSSKIFGNKSSFQTFGSNVTFNDVKGCDEAKYELEQTVEFLKNPWKFSKFGGRLSKGVLLHGPPGTGKHFSFKKYFFYCYLSKYYFISKIVILCHTTVRKKIAIGKNTYKFEHEENLYTFLTVSIIVLAFHCMDKLFKRSKIASYSQSQEHYFSISRSEQFLEQNTIFLEENFCFSCLPLE